MDQQSDRLDFVSIQAEWLNLPELGPRILRVGPKDSEMGYRLSETEAIALAEWILKTGSAEITKG